MYLYQQQVQHADNKNFSINFFAGTKIAIYTIANNTIANNKQIKYKGKQVW